MDLIKLYKILLTYDYYINKRKLIKTKKYKKQIEELKQAKQKEFGKLLIYICNYKGTKDIEEIIEYYNKYADYKIHLIN
jgi:hypothetical protein